MSGFDGQIFGPTAKCKLTVGYGAVKTQHRKVEVKLPTLIWSSRTSLPLSFWAIRYDENEQYVYIFTATVLVWKGATSGALYSRLPHGLERMDWEEVGVKERDYQPCVFRCKMNVNRFISSHAFNMILASSFCVFCVAVFCWTFGRSHQRTARNIMKHWL